MAFSSATKIAFILSFLAVAGCRSQRSNEPYRPVPAPSFQLKDLDGKELSLSSLKGKVVFIDFWATWCPPCVRSVPDVSKLHDDYAGQPVEVLSISVDQDESAVREFLHENSVSSRVAMAGDSGIDSDYDVSGIPAFFIINKEGMITKAWQGYGPRMADDWRAEIDKQLQT